MFQPWITIIAGLWALFSSFSIPLLHPANFIVVGIVVAIFSFLMPQRRWQGNLNGVLGLWLIISGIVPAFQFQGNLLIVGIAVTVISIWRIFEHRAPGRTAHAVR